MQYNCVRSANIYWSNCVRLREVRVSGTPVLVTFITKNNSITAHILPSFFLQYISTLILFLFLQLSFRLHKLYYIRRNFILTIEIGNTTLILYIDDFEFVS